MAVTIGTGVLINGGSVITTSNGNIYVFYVDTNGANLLWKKSTDGGTTFGSVNTVTSTTIHGNVEYIFHISAAIDGAGYIHVASEGGAANLTRDVSYSRLNTSNDTWDTWEQAAAFQKDPGGPRVSISIDSNNKPHILYTDGVANMGTTYTRIYYTNKTGASWLTPEMVSTGTTINYYSPNIIVRNSDIVEALYYSSEQQPLHRTRTSGSWGTETWTSDDTVTSQRSITANSSGTVYYYSRNSTSTNISENSSIIDSIVTYSTDAGYSACLINNTRYVIYIDNTDRDIKFLNNSGSGWSSASTLETGTYNRVVCEYAYNYEYQSGRINYIFDNDTNLYFNYLQLAPITNLGTPNEGQQLTDATPDLKFTATDQQSDTVDYQIQIDPANTFNSKCYNLKYVDLTILVNGTPTDDLILDVRINSASGTSLGQSTLTAAEIVDDQFNQFTLTDAIPLTAGTKYYVTVARSGSRDATNFYSLKYIANGSLGGGSIIRDSGVWSDEAATADLTIRLLDEIGNVKQQNIFSDNNYPLYGGSGTYEQLGQTFIAPSLGSLIDAASVGHTGFSAGANHPTASGAEQTYTVQSDLPVDTYYWRVRATDNNSGYGAWSDVKTFEIIASGTQETVTLIKKIYTTISAQVTVNESVTLDNHLGITSVENTNEKDALSLAKVLTTTTEGVKVGGATEESVSLAKYHGISILEIKTIIESLSLDNHYLITENSKLEIYISIALAKYLAETSTSQININNLISLSKSDFITILEKFLPNETVQLDWHGLIISVTSPLNVDSNTSLLKILTDLYSTQLSAQDSSLLDNHIAVSATESVTGAPIEESVILDKKVYSSSISEIEIDLSTALSKFIGQIATSQQNLPAILDLNKILNIIEVDQVNVNSGVSLGKSISITENDQVNIQDINNLSRSLAISVTEAVTGAPKEESVSLGIALGTSFSNYLNIEDIVNLVKSIFIAETNQLNGENNVILNAIKVVSETSQINVQDNISLQKYKGISLNNEINIQNIVDLLQYFGISIGEDVFGVPVEESLSLSKFLSVTQQKIQNIDEEIVLSFSRVINENDQCNINNTITLTSNFNITETEQLDINEAFTLSSNFNIVEVSQINISNSFILASNFSIEEINQLNISTAIILPSNYAIEESSQGNINNGITFTKNLVIQESSQCNVSSTVSLNRLAAQGENELENIQNIISLGKVKIISILSNEIANNISILMRFNNLIISEEAQGERNELVILNRSNGINTNTRISANDIVTLLELREILINENERLYEVVNLEYIKEILATSIPNISERVTLRKVDFIAETNNIIAFNIIDLIKYIFIEGEPQSLYVYTRGDHSIFVLFRDKRSIMLFRDKRYEVLFRDKRYEALFREKYTYVPWRDKRSVE